MEDGKAGKYQGNISNGTSRGLLPARHAGAGRVLPEAALDYAYVSHAGTFNHRF
jgi:hypothetical protein